MGFFIVHKIYCLDIWSVKKFKVSIVLLLCKFFDFALLFGYTEGDIHEHIYLRNKKYRMMRINQCVLK